MVCRYDLDAGSSRLLVRTRAKGLLSALAHDLEIAASGLSGQATVDGDAWKAELRLPVASMRVAGTLHGDRLDTAALSSSDRAEIERRIREDVITAAPEVVATGQGGSRSSGTVTVTIGAARATVQLRPDAREREGGSLAVSGRCELSLSALGIREVKGPLGAFKVADAVTVVLDLVLRPSA